MDQYRAIMEKDGRRLEDCSVISFVFPDLRAPERFHFSLLMTVPGPEYYVFDCYDNIANVVVPKDEKTIALVEELAEKNGGKRQIVHLI